jgi:phytoene dehydrogenase-like protein
MAVADGIVIGSGPNGLVAANLLADAGWDVEVLEAEPEPGGAVRSGETCEPGFVHDRFSSFYPFATISPPLLDFGLDAFGLRWRRSDAVLAHVSPDAGTVAVLEADLAASCAAFDADSPGDGEGWRVLCERWRRLEGGFARSFFTPFPPLAGPARMAARTDPRDLLRLARFLSLDVRRMGAEHFSGDGPRDLLAGTALHADLAPEAVGSGAFGWIMCGLGQHNGFPTPEGGSGELTRALVARLRERGGRLRCGARVDRILVAGGRAVGVRTQAGDEVRARHAVLADVEARSLYLDLVGPEHLSRRALSDLRRFQPDSSTIKVDWSLDAPIPWTQPGARRAACVHVTGGVDELSTTMTEMTTGRLPRAPFLVMGQYAATDPTRQPPGRETAWAYAHIPQEVRGDAAGELSGDLDAAAVERFADRMQARIETAAPGFGGLVRRRVVTGPAGLQAQDVNLAGGALNGGTTHLHQLAMFRPIPAQLGRPETTIGRLYLASASAHPSGGVHGAPGAIAARAALLRRAPWRWAAAVGKRHPRNGGRRRG